MLLGNVILPFSALAWQYVHKNVVAPDAEGCVYGWWVTGDVVGAWVAKQTMEVLGQDVAVLEAAVALGLKQCTRSAADMTAYSYDVRAAAGRLRAEALTMVGGSRLPKVMLSPSSVLTSASRLLQTLSRKLPPAEPSIMSEAFTSHDQSPGAILVSYPLAGRGRQPGDTVAHKLSMHSACTASPHAGAGLRALCRA